MKRKKEVRKIKILDFSPTGGYKIVFDLHEWMAPSNIFGKHYSFINSNTINTIIQIIQIQIVVGQKTKDEKKWIASYPKMG